MFLEYHVLDSWHKSLSTMLSQTALIQDWRIWITISVTRRHTSKDILWLPAHDHQWTPRTTPLSRMTNSKAESSSLAVVLVWNLSSWNRNMPRMYAANTCGIVQNRSNVSGQVAYLYHISQSKGYMEPLTLTDSLWRSSVKVKGWPIPWLMFAMASENHEDSGARNSVVGKNWGLATKKCLMRRSSMWASYSMFANWFNETGNFPNLIGLITWCCDVACSGLVVVHAFSKFCLQTDNWICLYCSGPTMQRRKIARRSWYIFAQEL